MSLRALARLAGGAVLRWLTLGALAGAALGGVELAIATFLLLFLESLGLSPFVAPRPTWLPAPLSLGTAVAMLVVVAAVRSIAHYLASQSSFEAQVGLDARLRRFLLHRIFRTDTRSVAAAEVHRQLADTFPRAAHAASQGSSFASAIVQAFVIALLMIVASPSRALVGLAGLGVVGALVLVVQRRVRGIAETIPAEQRALHRGIERVARNYVLVRVLGIDAREHRRLTGAVDAFSTDARRAARLVSLAYAATPFLGTLLLAAILSLASPVPTEGARLVAFVYLYVRFVQTLAAAVRTFTGLAQSWPQLREAIALGETLDDAARARALGPVPTPAARSASPAAPPLAVTIDGVRYRHPGAAHDVVRDFSVSVPAGEQLAIVGPSGSGKTTLLLLTLGFLDPDAGTVRLGERPPSELWSGASARVGYVGAEPYLVAGSLRENLAYGSDAAPSDDAMWEALRAVQLEATVRARPEGLGLPLDENGGGLSAGEQQRLSLARALLTSPSLLVLDEVSANLDAALEEEIVQLVRTLRGRCTTIVVSHRPAMVAHADRTIELSAR